MTGLLVLIVAAVAGAIGFIAGALIGFTRGVRWPDRYLRRRVGHAHVTIRALGIGTLEPLAGVDPLLRATTDDLERIAHYAGGIRETLTGPVLLTVTATEVDQ